MGKSCLLSELTSFSLAERFQKDKLELYEEPNLEEAEANKMNGDQEEAIKLWIPPEVEGEEEEEEAVWVSNKERAARRPDTRVGEKRLSRTGNKSKINAQSKTKRSRTKV